MSELIVVAFDAPDEADRVLTRVGEFKQEELADLDDAVVAIRDSSGDLRIKQSVPVGSTAAALGAFSGGLLGTLVGLIFLSPLSGLAAGSAIGAGAGALARRLVDYGINDDVIRAVARAVRPCTSALFLLVRRVRPEKVLAALEGFNGRIIRSSLSREQEAKLAEALREQGAREAQAAPVEPAIT
jgi:uncharacterized membrane protein